jgi:hypothetical protein
MTCPQCHHPIPAKSLWTRAGLSCVVCPHCHASLSPKPLTAVVLFLASFGMGGAVLAILRHDGRETWIAFAGFFLVFAVVFAVLAPLVLRLRPRGPGGEPHLSGNKA